jgi:hypothetical protein
VVRCSEMAGPTRGRASSQRRASGDEGDGNDTADGNAGVSAVFKGSVSQHDIGGSAEGPMTEWTGSAQ